eukprot:GAHX01002624.1.p1 GENE.GAHX01002624.1~~GAHX01002624.1.p1  ORF type:complete len:597 (+),score=110.98 GAHX01002624.1:1454-3244(+)
MEVTSPAFPKRTQGIKRASLIQEAHFELNYFLPWLSSSSSFTNKSLSNLSPLVYIVSLIEPIKASSLKNASILFDQTSNFHYLLSHEYQQAFKTIFSTQNIKEASNYPLNNILETFPFLQAYYTKKTRVKLNKFDLNTLEVCLKSNKLYYVSYLIMNYCTVEVMSNKLLNQKANIFEDEKKTYQYFKDTKNCFTDRLKTLIDSRAFAPYIKIKNSLEKDKTKPIKKNDLMDKQAILKMNIKNTSNDILSVNLNEKFNRIVVSEMDGTVRSFSLKRPYKTTTTKILNDYYIGTFNDYNNNNILNETFKTPILKTVFLEPYPLLLFADIEGNLNLNETHLSSKPFQSYYGHEGPVWDIDVSVSNAYFLTASEDFTCRFWDIEKGGNVRIFNHFSGVDNCCLGTRMNLCFCTTDDMCLHIYDIREGKKLYEINIQNYIGETQRILNVDIDDELKIIILGLSNGHIACLNLRDIDQVVYSKDLEEQKERKTNFHFSSILKGNLYGLAHIKNKLIEAKNIEEEKNIITSKPNKYNIAIGSKDGFLKVWDYRNVFYECDYETKKTIIKVDDDVKSCFLRLGERVSDKLLGIKYGVEGILTLF